MTEDRDGARTCAVVFLSSFVENALAEIKILFHNLRLIQIIRGFQYAELGTTVQRIANLLLVSG